MGSVSGIAAYLQTTSVPTAVLIGIAAACVGLLSAALMKAIDIWNERRKERKRDAAEDAADQEIEVAAEVAERSLLRKEERDYYNSLLVRVMEERRIASRRGHALGQEISRLQNQTLKLVQLWPRDVTQPLGVVIFNEDLNRYLAELEELPLPDIRPRPSSLGDPHTTSSADLMRPIKDDLL